jgi:hypothetical protein
MGDSQASKNADARVSDLKVNDELDIEIDTMPLVVVGKIKRLPDKDGKPLVRVTVPGETPYVLPAEEVAQLGSILRHRKAPYEE